MRVHERLFLNPFQKWQSFGVFPNTFAAHLLLLGLVTYQVLFYFHKDIDHACHTARHFSSLFLNAEEGTVSLLQPVDLQAAFETALWNAFDVDYSTFNHVRRVRDGSECLRCDVALQVLWRSGSVEELVLEGDNFNPRAPDARGSMRAYLHRVIPWLYNSDIAYVEDIMFRFEIDEMFITPDFLFDQPRDSTKFLWKMQVRFDGSKVGRFLGSLNYNLYVYHTSMSSSHDFMNMAVIVLALLSLVLVLRKVYRAATVLFKLRDALQGKPGLSLESQLDLFSRWWGLSVMCHFMQIYSTSRSLQLSPDVTQRFALLGWSCFFTWLNMCQYFEAFPSYYVTFSTLKKGMPGVLRYMASVIPILTAFMALGVCNFWKARTFQGVSASYASLFSLLNGDLVHDTFEDLHMVAGFAGHMYLYVFIFMFIYIVLNVNITIIEEAYFAARFQAVQHESRTAAYEGVMQTPVGDFPGTGTADRGLRSPLLTWPDGPVDSQGQDELTRPSSTSSESADAHGPAEDFRYHGWAEAPDVVEEERSGSKSSGGKRRRASIQGNLSQRFWENPKLRSALRDAFPEEAFDGTISFATDAGNPSRDVAAYSHPSDRLAWWLRILPEWTQTLRSMPLPVRSSVPDEHQWQQLQRVVADHSSALDEVAGNIYRTVSRL